VPCEGSPAYVEITKAATAAQVAIEKLVPPKNSAGSAAVRSSNGSCTFGFDNRVEKNETVNGIK